MYKISLNFQMLAQRLPNWDIQTAIISTTIQRWANRNIQITINRKKMYNFKIANRVNEAGVQTFLFRLAKRWLNAADLPKLANVGPTLGQRQQSYHDDRTKIKI